MAVIQWVALLVVAWVVGVTVILLTLRRSYRHDEKAIIEHQFQQMTKDDNVPL